jgi:glyoxylase-like metal-dependent hydrolase (beta-lactamase superfamily II)
MLIQNPPVEVGDRLWMLGTAAYPVFLVRGQNEGAIIEGGISALGTLLRRQFTHLGIGPDFVRQIIVTHAHPDHVMAIPLLREMFPGATVVASAPAAATLRAEKAISFFRQMDAALTAGLLKDEVNAEQPAPLPLVENCIVVDRVVGEGEVIAVEDTAWTVLETPGHSECSISLYDSARRMLVISDATGYYMPDSDSWWPNYFFDYAAYVRSIERLAGLNAEVLCLSHNGAITGADDVRSYFTGVLAATRQYHERIVAESKSGKPSRQLAEELGAEIHQHTSLMPVEFFQKNCGLLIKQSLRYEEKRG